MAGCVPCFIIPLLVFIFHRYIQPILLKFWNPWEKKQLAANDAGDNATNESDEQIRHQSHQSPAGEVDPTSSEKLKAN